MPWKILNTPSGWIPTAFLVTFETLYHDPYQKAVKALEDCVKDAMENNVDPGLQSEIWRHYQGMKAIQRQLA